jgi:ubiquinone/menaquinone biosynthesis C-methylase UbiE
MAPEPGYVFDNAAVRETARRFASLEGLFDPVTTRIMESIGVREGWRCLEIGGGGGSIARWLAQRVGSSGHVVVTDLDPRFLQSALRGFGNVEIVAHDVAKDALQEGSFDLAHERLVLQHIPTREKVLTKVISSLKSQGWLLFEGFDSSALSDAAFGDPKSVEVHEKLAGAKDEMFVRHGTDANWGKRLLPLFHEHGLTEIGMEAHATLWRGGSKGAELQKANFEQLRGEIVGAGLMTEAELDEGVKIFDDPRWGRASSLMISVWGRKP